jgi:hypothetical protein
MSRTIVVQDVRTKQKFNILASSDRVTVETKDGVRVKIYPVAQLHLTKRGEIFSGQTVTGTRDMRLLS